MQRFQTLIRAIGCSLAAGVFWIMMLVASAQAEVRTIGDGAALTQALRENLTGVTLALAPGTYPAIALRGPGAPAAIVSADPSNPARVLGLQGADVSDLRLEHLVFDYRFDEEDAIHIRPFMLRRCDGLVVRGNRFEGDYARGLGFPHDGRGYGMGLSFRECTNVLVEENYFEHFYKGINIRETANLTIRGNELTALRMDGMTFAQVSNVLIEGNHIHSFERVDVPEDHADMIQFWTTQTTEPSRNVTIRGNILNSGAGLFTQSIFLRNPLVDSGQAGHEMFYRNFTIEENVILNAHLHGITMGETEGLIIRRNTLIQNRGSVRPGASPDTPLYTPQIRVAPTSIDVLIEGNITHRLVGHQYQRDWQVAGNLLMYTPGARPVLGYASYTQVFVDGGETGPHSTVSNWRLIPGGLGDRPDLGAQYLQ